MTRTTAFREYPKRQQRVAKGELKEEQEEGGMCVYVCVCAHFVRFTATLLCECFVLFRCLFRASILSLTFLSLLAKK